MNLPFRVTGTLLLKAIDGALALGIKLDEWLGRRKQKKGLPLEDVAHIKAQSEAGARAVAKTVILPKRP